MASNPFNIPVPSAAQAIMGFERAKKLSEDRTDIEFRKGLQREELDLRKKKLAQSSKPSFRVTDLPGVGQVQQNTRTGEIKALPLSFDQRTALKRAGKTDVTVNTGDAQQSFEAIAEKEAAKVSGRKDAELISTWRAEGVKADQMISDLNLMEQLVVGAKTGSLSDIRTAVQGYAEALNVDISDITGANLGDAQALESIVNRVAPTFRVVGSGSTSDKEFGGLLKSFPGLTKSPQGNMMIISILKARSARNKQIVDIAGTWNSIDPNTGKRITTSEVMRRVNKLPPMFSKDMATTTRLLSSNSISVNPIGGPNGGPDVVFNPQKGTIKRWFPETQSWRIVKSEKDLKR